MTGDRIPVTACVILAEANKSPYELEEGLPTDSLQLHGFEKQRVYLEAGGIVVAEGTIVKRRGQAYFRVRSMNSKSNAEAV